MSVERNNDILKSRSAFRDIQMPARVVRDRPVGTFSHDIESLRENSFAVVITGSDSEIGLVSKSRNYSATEYDIMVSCLDNERSSLHEMTEQDRNSFFSLVASIANRMHKISGLPFVVGLNQHPNGHKLPYKNEVGQKNRVQTLQPLHVHIYETAVFPDGSHRMGDLNKEDQRDICDPLVLLSGDVLRAELSRSEIVKNAGAKTVLTITEPPLGLNITFPIDFTSFLTSNSHLLAEIQTKALSVYERIPSLFIQPSDGNIGELLPVDQRMENVRQFLDSTQLTLSQNSQRMLYTLARNIKDAAIVPSYNTFISGPAVTYTIIDRGDGKTLLNVHPRLMSRGNSPDSYCIYVDNEKTQSAETKHDIATKIVFYERLIKDLGHKFDIYPGQFMLRKNAG